MIDSALGFAYDFFTSALTILYNLLTTDLLTYSRDAHIRAYAIIRAFKAIATAIVLILTYMSFIRQSSIIIERHPESVIKVLLRAVIVSFLVVNCTTYFGDVFAKGLAMLAKTVFNSAGIYGGDNFRDYFNNLGFSAVLDATGKDDKVSKSLSEMIESTGLALLVIGVKIYYIITLLRTGFNLIVLGFTRFIKIYMYTCTMPIGISFFADPNFSQYGKNYARTYIGVLLEGATIAITIVMFCNIVKSNIIVSSLNVFDSVFKDANAKEAMKYFLYSAMLNTSYKIIENSEQITQKLFGFA